MICLSSHAKYPEEQRLQHYTTESQTMIEANSEYLLFGHFS